MDEEEEEEGEAEAHYLPMEHHHQPPQLHPHQQLAQYESRAKRPRLMVRKIEDLVDDRMMKGRIGGVSRRTSHTGTSISSDDHRDDEDDDEDGDDEGTGAESSDQHGKFLQRKEVSIGRYGLPKLSNIHSRFLVAMEEQHSKKLAEESIKHRCPVCDQGFGREPDLMVHVRTHPDLPTFKCPLCELTFIGSDFLKNHLKKHVIGNGEDPDAPGAIDLKAEPTPPEPAPSGDGSSVDTVRTSLSPAVVVPSAVKLPKPIITSKPPSTGISLLKPIEERKPPDHQQEYCVKTADGKFMCTVCERLFSHQQTVRIHFRNHTNEKPYKCTFCEESYIRSDYLERHLKVHFKDGMLPAVAIASMAAAAAAVATGGSRSATSSPPPTMKEESLAESPATPAGGMSSATGSGSTGKPLIGRAGLAPENYHFTESNDGQFVCKICDAVFNQVALLRKHALAHTEEKPFHCDICDRSFNRVDYLKEHFKSKRHLQLVAEAAAGGDSLPAALGNRADEEDDDSTMDEAIASANRSKAVGRKGNVKQPVEEDVRNGEGVRPVDIKENNSSSSSSSSGGSSRSSSSSRSSINSNRNNTSAASNPSPVKQKEAGETRSSVLGEFHRSDYERTSDGRYKCNQCDKTFVTAVTLKMHIRLHTGEKPYKCDKCDKAFIRSDYLKTHEKCHRQESFLSMLSLTTSKEPSTASEAGDSDADGEPDEERRRQQQQQHHRGKHVVNGGGENEEQIVGTVKKEEQEDDSDGEDAEDEEEEEEEEEGGEEEAESEESDDEQVIEVMVKEASCSESEEDDEDGEDEEEDEEEDDEDGEDNAGQHSPFDNSTNRIASSTMIESAHSRKEKGSSSKRRNRAKDSARSGRAYAAAASGGDSSNNGFDHEDDSTSQASGPAGGQQYGGSGAGEYMSNGQKGKHRCPMCDKLFAWPKSLKIHLRTHTGEKPYRCDLCGKCFGRSDSLRGHKRTHSDDKLIQCHLCDVSCATVTELVQHQYTVHGLKPLES
uniref:C2H2-type domain-containing protein n=1 Tax=Anopheles maculatus TaxID=74869 RepID=A0A182SEH8_9DIPT